ncbi:Putative phospholipid-transporting ATPase FetA [Heterocephalus glaber]|uniref:Phospholipid-transporting ATPase n=1 Tax=Heterocephalus glaber TaxID=10181 RepID=G5BL07_HETGA|nr:Putative phospholipid-transporting ATPase FetA [Heterocephalus glaber]
MSLSIKQSEDRKNGGENERLLQANNRKLTTYFGYPNNTIKTSKYNALNFLPTNLFEQFQRLANAYFLILVFLQLIPQISSLASYTTVIPLTVVLSITAMKDAIDDMKRHQSDSQVNNRPVLLLVNGRMEEDKWMNVQVGDIIKLKNNQPVTADILLLSSSEPYSLAYIETAELDGETNLKVKQAISVTSDLEDNLELLSAFDGEVKCDPPNNKLDKFTGILTYKGQKYLLDHDKLLLRGCIIRNTDWCYGLVIYTGPDTKLMKNSGKSIFKRTQMDRLVNVLVLWIFLLLGIMCFIIAVGHGIWQSKIGYYFQIFLPWENYVSSSVISATLIYWSYFIVLNTMVPISIYISVEIIRLGNSFYINGSEVWKMFYAPKNTPAQARTTTLNEELGQVKYVFSDKTGTLTRNIMVFNKCSIYGKLYGGSYDTGGSKVPDSKKEKVDFSYNKLANPNFSFYYSTLVEAVKNGDNWVHLFFLSLSLCHTVMSEEKVEGELVYQAQSPDEGALVTAARNFGFVFHSRTSETITVVEMGVTRVYQLLAILDFNSVRKRMSVIVRTPEDRLMLFCKGADTIICELLHSSCTDLNNVTMEHLDCTHVFQDFATKGLCTLMVAYRELDTTFFQTWSHKHSSACLSLEDRENKLSVIYEKIEKDLMLLGATAIEDKLQDAVPETIITLNKAKIKIRVLTGDKQDRQVCPRPTEVPSRKEHAKSAHGPATIHWTPPPAPLYSHLVPHYKDAEDIGPPDHGTESHCSRPRGHHPYRCSQPLSHLFQFRRETAVNIAYSCSILDDEMDGVFVVQGKNYETVYQEVRTARAKMKPESLLESDPTNIHLSTKPKMPFTVPDKEPNGNYGLVINGYSLKAQVVELVKRYKKVVTLAIGDGANDVSMIKGINFWGFIATAHIGVGISGLEGMQAMLNSDFSFSQFHYLQRLLLVHGRWSYNRMCKFLSYFFYKNFAFTLVHFWYAFYNGFSAQKVYDSWFITCYNLIYASLPVLGLSLFDQIALKTTYWTLMSHLFIWGSLGFYFCMLFLLYSDGLCLMFPNIFQFLGVARNSLNQPQLWLSIILSTVLCIIPAIGYIFLKPLFYPVSVDKVFDRIHHCMKYPLPPPIQTRLKHSSLRRSAYAFSHQQGFGDLITSGKTMKIVPKKKNSSSLKN